jgi:hypothetical protein
MLDTLAGFFPIHLSIFRFKKLSYEAKGTPPIRVRIWNS